MTLLLWACLQAAVPVPLVNDRAPDTSSLKALVTSVTRGCRTDDERAIALYHYGRYVLYHHAYPSEPGGIGALKLFNVYGWSLCGGEHTALAALFEQAGWRWRYRGWSSPGHTTVEAFYGGRWHWLDIFLKFFVWRPDAQAPGGWTLASQEDIVAQPGLLDAVTDDPVRRVGVFRDGPAEWQAPTLLVCGDGLGGVLSGVRSSRSAGDPRGWGGIVFDEPKYDAVPKLPPGCALTLEWAKDPTGHVAGTTPAHSCRDKDYRWCPVVGPLLEPYSAQQPAQSWSNGHLLWRPDLSKADCLASCAETDNVTWRDGALAPTDAARPGVLTLEVALPYPVVRVTPKLISAQPDPTRKVELPKAGTYTWRAQVTFTQPLTGVELDALVEHNQRALPYLAPGRNQFAIGREGELPPGARVVCTLAYEPGSRDRSIAALWEAGMELGRGHKVRWEAPVVVQRSFDRLPATFTVDVPTPKGRQPVYPRMLFVRREVLLPGQAPLPTPAPPSTPAAGPDATLATLPEPWTMGNRPPAPARPAGPTRTVALPFGERWFVAADGQVAAQAILRWPKLPAEKVLAWAWALGKPTGALPAAEKILSAKLVFRVAEAHDKAPCQVAAVTLPAGCVAGQAFDLTRLGPLLGTTTVDKSDGKPFVPPREYAIDVTRAMRGWAETGGELPGLALRVWPNRGIDDGWTVRFQPPPDVAPELRLEVPQE